MAYVTTAQARSFLRLSEDQYTDDEIDQFVASATAAVMQYLEKPSAYFEGTGGIPDQVLAVILQATARVDAFRETGEPILTDGMKETLHHTVYFGPTLA